MKRLMAATLMAAMLLSVSARPASAFCLFNCTYAKTKYPIVLAHGFGCEATIAQFPDWTLEDDKLFNTMLPDATTGACPAGPRTRPPRCPSSR